METPTIHYFDVEERRIACGHRGFDQRSTKHARYVTCEACRAALDAQASEPESESEAPTRWEPAGDAASA